MNWLSVDPGKFSGWAYFEDGSLISCGLDKEPYDDIPNLGIETLVIERPHPGKSKASTKDLITLAGRMGRIIGRVGADRVVEVLPVQWKGSVPKTIRTPGGVTHPSEDRIKRDMSHREMGVFLVAMQQDRVAQSYRHNVMDAIGIGVWYRKQQRYT